MNLFKKEINTTADGTTELFQLGNTYIADSVVVFEILSDGSVQSKTVAELGTDFVQVTPAPAIGSKLLCLYEYDDPAVEQVNNLIPGLSPWEGRSLNKLVEVIKTVQDSVTLIESYLKERVTKEEFHSWAAVIEKRVQEKEGQF